MRRAAVQVLRAAQRNGIRRVLLNRTIPVQRPRPLYIPIKKSPNNYESAPLHVLQSSLYLRSFSVAALVSAIASGVWYYQTEPPSESRQALSTTSPRNTIQNTSSSSITSSTAPSLSVATPSISDPPTVSEETVPDVKSVVPIEDENFYLAEIAADTVLEKRVENDGAAKMEKVTPEQATSKLRKLEQSYSVGRGQGVVRYDLVQVPSNNPIEDDHVEKIVQIPQNVAPTSDGAAASDWMFWGVFDGHSGWTTSARLRQKLVAYVTRELTTVYRSAFSDPQITIPSPDAIDDAIKQGFVKLDYDIVHKSVEEAFSKKTKAASTEILAPALSGSCALLSYYDTSSKLFRVACTGDSRAVLGRKGPSGRWTATPLSEDQTGGTPSEIARLRKEHPGEPEVTLHGRILGGLEPSRAFGDASYKWAKDLQAYIHSKFFGRSSSSRLKTPPYVTAEPIVTTTKIQPENGDFVVLATDGLWEMLTNEEVVGLVGQWIEKQKTTDRPGLLSWSALTGRSNKTLPVDRLGSGPESEQGQRAPIRQKQWSVTQGDERFVTEDRNVATHLVRNALGGNDSDMVCSLLSLVSPYSRRYR